MNISPTPRRYNSRNGGIDFNDENYFAFPNPINRNPNGNGANRERIVPEEYRLNSQMINRLIRQNKELMTKLDSKQEEIDRLNVLVGSLRGKLIKYTELNKKLEDKQNMSRSSSDSNNINDNTTMETNSDYIQLPKRRNNPNKDFHKEQENDPKFSKDDRISALSEKLDMLTKLMMESRNNSIASPPPPIQQKQSANVPTPATAPTSTAVPSSTTATMSPPPPTTTTSIWQRPSEEDIMCRESMELKQLEDQIESLKRKLLIRRENELRKLSLNQELLELMGKLSIEQAHEQAHPHPQSRSQSHQGTNVTSNEPQNSSSPEYCVECHHAASNPSLNHHQSHNLHHLHHLTHANNLNPRRPTVPAINPLETPTPFTKRTSLAASTGDLTDTINRVW